MRRLLITSGLLLFFAVTSFCQNGYGGEFEGVIVTTGPANVKRIIRLNVFNGILVKDSIKSKEILGGEAEKYKTKIKSKEVSKEIAEKLGLSTEKYTYFFRFVEIKDVIIDPETFDLISLK